MADRVGRTIDESEKIPQVKVAEANGHINHRHRIPPGPRGAAARIRSRYPGAPSGCGTRDPQAWIHPWALPLTSGKGCSSAGRGSLVTLSQTLAPMPTAGELGAEVADRDILGEVIHAGYSST